MTTPVNQEIEESAAPTGCPMHAKKAADGVSRRGFIGALGAAGAMAPGVCMMGASSAAHAQTAATTIREDRFGRIFRLPPFATPSPQLTAALTELGKVGGIMDAKDPLEVGPDPAHHRSCGPRQQSGQHDADRWHDVLRPVRRSRCHVRPGLDARRADTAGGFDQYALAGDGPRLRVRRWPGAQPAAVWPAHAGEPLGGIKLRVEHGGLFEDLPRTADGTAILGDPRNDEHVILAGLHAAFLMFHNEAVDYVAARNRRWSTDEIFREAQRLVRWHYQWIIVHEFLPQVIGQSLVNNILRNGRRIYRPSVGFMPVEFQGAVYRMGHSMVRPSYRANMLGDNGGPFFAFIFDPAAEGQTDPSDLRGGVRTPRRFVGWQTFFDFGDGEGEAEQAARHDAVLAVIPAAALDHRWRGRADLARAAQSPAAHHVVAAVGTGDRA